MTKLRRAEDTASRRSETEPSEPDSRTNTSGLQPPPQGAKSARRLRRQSGDHGAVEEHRQRVDEGLVDAGVVEVEQLLELPLERGGVRVAPVRVAGVPRRRAEKEPDEEVQQAGDEEDDGQDQDDEEDAGADPALKARISGRRRRWWRRRRQQRRER